MTGILKWKDVLKKHKVVAGISTKDGLVRSLLCNPGSDQLYPNEIKEHTITYYVGVSTQTYGIKALFRSFEEGNSFSVFEKMGINKWKELGSYKIESMKEQEEGFTGFNLVKV